MGSGFLTFPLPDCLLKRECILPCRALGQNLDLGYSFDSGQIVYLILTKRKWCAPLLEENLPLLDSLDQLPANEATHIGL